MLTLNQFATKLSRAAAVLASAILVAMTLLILAEIVMRTLYHTSTFITEEFVGYGLAAFTFLGLGYTLGEGGLIKMSLLLDRLPWGGRRWLMFGGVAATIGVTGFLGYSFWSSMALKFRAGTIGPTIAEVPLWIPEAFVLLGLAIFGLQLTVEAWLLLGRSEDGSRQ